MKNKGQMNWGTIVTIILGVILLAGLVYGFSFGFDKMFSWSSKENPELPQIMCYYYDCQIIYAGGTMISTLYDGSCYGVDNIKIGSREVTMREEMCHTFMHLSYDDLKNEFNSSKSYAKGITNLSKVKTYLDKKGYFFVSNPNSQISLDGDIELSGTGSGTGSAVSCGVLFCRVGMGSYSMNLDLKGTISMSGDIQAPVSFIDEKRLNQLNNGEDFVKCYLQTFDDVYTIYNEPLQKLICGIEKNNVFVIADIESIESDMETCSTIDVPAYVDGHPWKDLKINPGVDCSKVWEN